MDKGFSPAEWPLSPCFHPHSRGAIVSLGACWAFSVQPVLPSVWRPVVSLKWNVGQAINAVTGTRLWAFVFSLPGTRSILFLPFGFTRLRPRSFGCCCAMVRTLLRSPTGDAVTPPAFSRSQRSLASFRSFRHAPPVSGPNAAGHSPPRTVPECVALPVLPAAFANTGPLPC